MLQNNWADRGKASNDARFGCCLPVRTSQQVGRGRGRASALIIFATFVSLAMAGPRWERYYGGRPQTAEGCRVRPAPGAGYIVAGWRDGLWVLRVDSLGDSLWAIGVRTDDAAIGILPTDDGNWIATGGYFRSDTTGFYVTKISDLGETLWSKLYLDRALMMGPRAMAREPSGGFLVVGEVHDTGGPGIAVADGYAVLFDRDGNSLWSKRYVALGDDEFQAVLRPEQGGYLFAGSTFDDTLTRYEWAWLVRVDDNGDTMWTRKYRADSTACEGFEGVVQASDGGYVEAGGVATDTSQGNYCLGKTDSAGNLEWFRTYGGPAGDCAYAVCVTPDSGYALIGQCSSYGAGSYDAWLVKTDAGGNVQWSKTYGGTNWDQGNDIATTPDGGYIFTGQTCSTPGAAQCVYLVKTDSTGSAAILEGSERRASRERAVVSIQLGPSVVTGLHVAANYSVPESGPVEIAFYDVTGQRLAVLASGRRAAGRHQETLLLPDRRGVGYVRIVTPSGSATAKLVMSGP